MDVNLIIYIYIEITKYLKNKDKRWIEKGKTVIMYQKSISEETWSWDVKISSNVCDT